MVAAKKDTTSQDTEKMLLRLSEWNRGLAHPVTDFQLRVYQLLVQVPAGYVTTYANIARALHSSPRAVGNALRNNPFAPQVPCHRVIASTGFVNGFNGELISQATFQRDEEGQVSGLGKGHKSDPKGAKKITESEIMQAATSASNKLKSDIIKVDDVSQKLVLLHEEGVDFNQRGMLSDKSQIWDGPWHTVA